MTDQFMEDYKRDTINGLTERMIDILRRVSDLPYFKNAPIEALVRDARDLLPAVMAVHDAGLPTAEDVRGILATPPLTSKGCE